MPISPDNHFFFRVHAKDHELIPDKMEGEPAYRFSTPPKPAFAVCRLTPQTSPSGLINRTCFRCRSGRSADGDVKANKVM